MTAAAQPTHALQAATHITHIQTLLPNLPPAQRDAFAYALLVAENPGVDQAICQEAGKVVQITASFADRINYPVMIRGNMNPTLAWDTDHQADLASQSGPQSSSQRTFTFPVPPAQMNDSFEFKLCALDTQNHMAWSSGDNWTVDLSQHGHIVQINVTGVKFS